MRDLEAAVAVLPDRTLLLLDDDGPLRNRLGRALEARGFLVTLAQSVAEALDALFTAPPAFAVLDMRLEDGSGLKVGETLHSLRPDALIIMLTGYGNIATAVAAAKAGVVDYLTKPADADDIAGALIAATTGERPEPPQNPLTAERMRWEHIRHVYETSGHNVSEAARQLGMHRQSLQRILSRPSPR